MRLHVLNALKRTRYLESICPSVSQRHVKAHKVVKGHDCNSNGGSDSGLSNTYKLMTFCR